MPNPLLDVRYKGSIDIEGRHDPVFRDALEMTGQQQALDYLKECRGGPEFVPDQPAAQGTTPTKMGG